MQKEATDRMKGGGSESWRDDPGHLEVLTGLRGWAALSVFLFHIWLLAGKPAFEWTIAGMVIDLTPPIRVGFAGVTMFFVLSGFLLALPFAKWQAGEGKRGGYGEYIKRRALRVFPAYYVQLAVLMMLAYWTAWPVPIPDTANLWKHLLMLFVPEPIGAAPELNMVWWTLPIEFSFYIVLPVLAGLLAGRRAWMLFALSLGCMVVWRYWVATSMADAPLNTRVYASYQLPGAMDMFGTGMLAAVLQANRERLPRKLKTLLSHDGTMITGLLAMLIAAYWLVSEKEFYWANYPIFYLWTPVISTAMALLILSAANGNEKMRLLFGNRVIVFLGVISYSFYLWHLPVINGLIANGFTASIIGNNFALLGVVGGGLTCILSMLSYRWVERPAMRLGRRI